MEHSEKTKDCLAWLNKNYILSSLSIADIIDLTIEWNNKNAMENAAQCYQWQQERKQKEEEKAKSRIDFNEEIDENGRIWYKRTLILQYWAQRILLHHKRHPT